MSLPTPNSTPPVSLTRPAQSPLPIVIDSPHSGTAYPEDFRYSAPFELLRRGEDLYVERLYAQAPRFGATFIAANFPRAYIDPNRLLADIQRKIDILSEILADQGDPHGHRQPQHGSPSS